MKSSVLARCLAREEDRAERDRDEGENAKGAVDPFGRRLTQDDGSRCNRQRIRQQRRHACDRQRPAVLVAELQQSSPERVPDDDADCQDDTNAALRRHLHRDVADREEQSARHTLSDRESAGGSSDRKRDDRRRRRQTQPLHDVVDRPSRSLAAASREGDREDDQAQHRHPNAGELAPPEPDATHPRRDESEHPDATRGDALHEGQRGECQRGDVEREAHAFKCEARQPAAVPQKQRGAVERSPK
jgi:hypothetical protein